jgi:hypothetical protein
MYLYEMVTKQPMECSELSLLLEWESNLFSSKDSAAILKEVDTKIDHPAFKNPASPASIVLYSTLYTRVLIGTSQKYLNYLDHPALLNFVIRVSETDHSEKGIKLANEHTAAEKVDSSLAGATPNTSTSTVRKLKLGIFANKLDGKKM